MYNGKHILLPKTNTSEHNTQRYWVKCENNDKNDKLVTKTITDPSPYYLNQQYVYTYWIPVCIGVSGFFTLVTLFRLFASCCDGKGELFYSFIFSNYDLCYLMDPHSYVHLCVQKTNIFIAKLLSINSFSYVFFSNN